MPGEWVTMKGELQDRRSRALTIAGAMLGLLGVAALPLGVVLTAGGHRWALLLGALVCFGGLASARRLLRAAYWGEHPDWRPDGVPPETTSHGIDTLL
jgi:hypothetical protein